MSCLQFAQTAVLTQLNVPPHEAMAPKTRSHRRDALILTILAFVTIILLSRHVSTPLTRTLNPSFNQPPRFGPCNRPGALLDDDGKSCRDLKEAMWDQRICAAVSNGARYLTCVPPKNGSSYHKGLIFRILGDAKFDKIGNVHKNQAVKARMKLENFSNEEIAGFFTDGTMPKYAIVRNPVVRTLSGYLNSIERKENQKTQETFQKWVWKTYPKGLSNLATPRRLNPHVRSQFEYCGFRFPDVYRQYQVFRFEEPEKYVDFMYKIVPEVFLKDGWGGERNMSFREFSLAPRERTHDTEARFVDYVGSVKLYDHLVEVLRDDIEFFGYRNDVRLLRKKVVAAYGE